MKTREEIEKRIAVLKEEIDRVGNVVSIYNSMQLAVKIVNNGG